MQQHPRSPTGTVEEAATLLGVGRTLAYQEAKAGRLPGVFRIGRVYRVSMPILYQHLGLSWPPVIDLDAGEDDRRPIGADPAA